MAHRLLFLGMGAALMYFMDPQAGRRRRADLGKRVDATADKLRHGREMVVRDAANRTQGLLAETRHAIQARREGGVLASGTSLATVARDAASSWRRPRWSPAQRALAGACGTALAAYGYLRGGLKGFALCALGGGLIARSTANEGLAEVLRNRGNSATGDDPARMTSAVETGYLPRDAAALQPPTGSNGADAAPS